MNTELLEKYGSALDNPEIFTNELLGVMNKVLDAIDNMSYLRWEEFKNLPFGDAFEKKFKFKKTKWCAVLQFLLYEKENPRKYLGRCCDVQFKSDGKITAVVELYNILKTSRESLMDVMVHELKHAYFDYYHPKGGKRIERYKSSDSDDHAILFYMPFEKVLDEYNNDKELVCSRIMDNLSYLSSETETTAYAETVALEIKKYASMGKSLDELKTESKYVSHFIKLAKMIKKIEEDIETDDELAAFLNVNSKGRFKMPFKKFWDISKKAINKQLSNIRKNIGLYYQNLKLS